MINYLSKRIELLFRKPLSGDSFFADPVDFISESPSERIFYGLTNRYGHNEWNFMVANNTYRFTITSAAMPYYICEVEILATSVRNPNVKTWIKRSYPKRIQKNDFHRLIAEGRLVRTTSQSLFK